MATDVGVGDSEVPYLVVEPADTDTAVTLTVTGPDGSSSPVPMSGGTLTVIDGVSPVEYTQTWTADDPVTYTAPGHWVLHFVVTGTGEGAEDLDVYVTASPTAGGPTWAPGRSRVAAYVPHRTLVRSTSSTTGSADSYAWTWDDTTTPPGSSVDRLIADGVAWVTARVYPMAVTSQQLAATCAALYAAAAVERGWPQDDQALQRANDLDKRLDQLMGDLIAANTSANRQGDDVYPAPVNPQWAFPPQDSRWDDSRYF